MSHLDVYSTAVIRINISGSVPDIPIVSDVVQPDYHPRNQNAGVRLFGTFW